MNHPIPRGVRVAAVATILFPVLVGCSHQDASTSSTTQNSSTASASASGAASSGAATASGSAGASTATSAPPPSISATPAPSTAGDLTQKSFVLPPGWTPVVADISQQGLTPNGVPVHARDGAELSLNMLQPCGRSPQPVPANPAHVLEMNLKRGANLGVGELIEFSTPAQAQAWFTALRTQLTACPSIITRVESTGSLWRDRRNLGGTEVYSEVDVLKGRRIVNYALQDPQHSVDTAALAKLVLAQA